MQPTQQDFFKQAQIIHYALLAGLLLQCAVMYFLVSGSTTTPTDGPDELFRYLVPGLAAVAVLVGRFVSRRIFAQAPEQQTLQDKIELFRRGMIVRWAMIEGAGLFACVAYFLTGNLPLLLVALAAAIYLFTLRPTREAAAAALGLSEGEYRAL